MSMLHRLYDRLLALAAHRYGAWWLAAVAFAESSFFPLPPDAMLIPMVLARRDRAWRLALVCTLASVAGGAFGYLIGYALLDQLAQPLLRAYGLESAFAAFQARYAQWGVWVILIKGLTPIPYKLVTIASGAAAFNFPLFMLASLATRGARFFLEAALLHRYGTPVRNFIEQRLTLVTSLAAAGAVAGVLVLKLL
jgi:membrane protein YqaA with SNARE-associated domain